MIMEVVCIAHFTASIQEVYRTPKYRGRTLFLVYTHGTENNSFKLNVHRGTTRLPISSKEFCLMSQNVNDINDKTREDFLK